MKKFTIEQRKKEFEKALQSKYLSCIFDIDGTLADAGDAVIPDYITAALANVAMQRPIAICTGRRLEHVFYKIDPLFSNIGDSNIIRNNVFLLCENGGVGYFYNSENKNYVEFHRTQYPYGAKHQKDLFDEINRQLGAIFSSSFMNQTTMVFQPLNVNDPDKESLLKRSRDLLKQVEKILIDFDTENLLKIADSGIGSIILPIDGDKRNGVYEFGQFLKKNMGYDFSDSMKEFVVVGDKPDIYGNDQAFLDGTFGTGFTVGDILEHSLCPLPVFDLSTDGAQRGSAVSNDEGILKGSLGTFKLLQQLKFE